MNRNSRSLLSQDKKDPSRHWRVYEKPRFGYDNPDVDYAIVTRVFDESTRRPLISAAESRAGARAPPWNSSPTRFICANW